MVKIIEYFEEKGYIVSINDMKFFWLKISRLPTKNKKSRFNR
jgi:hypothetical protein